MMSGSVAVREMAPAIRGTGVSGMLASSSLVGSLRMNVSFVALAEALRALNGGVCGSVACCL